MNSIRQIQYSFLWRILGLNILCMLQKLNFSGETNNYIQIIKIGVCACLVHGFFFVDNGT